MGMWYLNCMRKWMCVCTNRGDPSSNLNSSSGEHECLYKIIKDKVTTIHKKSCWDISVCTKVVEWHTGVDKYEVCLIIRFLTFDLLSKGLNCIEATASYDLSCEAIREHNRPDCDRVFH